MTLTLWKDNRLPIITDTITANGSAVNLGSSTVKFKMRQVGSASLKIDASATVVSAPAGTVSYAWAAADVDVVGSYLCWWEVTTSAKAQDTPEFALEVVEHAPDSVPVSTPVGVGGATTIYAGDAYLGADERALHYEVELLEMKDLTGLTVTWRVESHTSKVMTVAGVDGLKVDLTSAETTAIPTGVHQMEIEATTSTGNRVTLLRSTLTVNADMV